MKFNKKAFSVAEAMVTLLIVSIALAAAAPIMSKKMNSSANSLNNINKLREEITELRQQVENANNANSLNQINELREEITELRQQVENTNNNITTNVNNNQKQINNINNNITTNVNNLQQQINNINNTVPAGTIAFFNKACTKVSGWKDVPTQWKGRYPRIVGTYDICDKTGENADGTCKNASKSSQTISYQAYKSDAIRNITGEITRSSGSNMSKKQMFGEGVVVSGAFSQEKADIYPADDWVGDGTRKYAHKLTFNASSVVPTANENLVKTVGLYMCIKE